MISAPETIANSSRTDEVHLATTGIHFDRILVATDFSQPANKALNLAISIGEAFDSEIFLVHSVSTVPYSDGQEPIPAVLISAALETARQEMKDLVAGEPRLAGLRLQTTVAYADPSRLVDQIAQDEKINLVVVGSQGANGLERMVLGSVAEDILRKMACPVLIAGPNCRIEQEPFKSILFATDLDIHCLRAAQYASALAERFDGQLTVLHTIPERPEAPTDESILLERRAVQQLRSLLPADADLFCHPGVRVEYGSPAERIVSVAIAEAATLLVLGLRNRSALADRAPWSKLSHIIREAKCAVLGVRGHLL